MKELIFFELKNCPYCIRVNQYLNELMEDPKYQAIKIRKIDEAKEGSLLQVMDYAVVPDKKSSPGRMLIVLTVFFLTGFFVLLWSFVREAFISIDSDPEKEKQIKDFRKALQWKA